MTLREFWRRSRSQIGSEHELDLSKKRTLVD